MSQFVHSQRGSYDIACATSLDRAVHEGYLIGKNPASRTKFPPMRHSPHIYLTTAEVAALTQACAAQGDVVLILAHAGLRFGELTALNVEDVNLGARRRRFTGRERRPAAD